MKGSKHIILFFSFFLSICLYGQNKLSGQITDEEGMPIPYAQIYVKNNAELRTQADVNGNYSIQLFEGEYFMVYSYSGYTDREAYVIIKLQDEVRNMQLFPKKISEIEEVQVVAKKSNPGREIMLEVVKVREKINPWNYPHSTEVYIMASEVIENKIKEEKKEKANEDPFEAEQKKQKELAGNLNIAEIKATRDFSPPNKVKETRHAVDIHGNQYNLYYTTTVKSNFNFFENLLHLSDLHENPVTSPVSGPGIISYKYRLEAQYIENGRKIHKIKIIPRMSSTSTLSGYIYVIDSLWLIQKIDLTMEKGNLLVYDYFNIKQEFSHPGDSMCVLTSQTLTYTNKAKNQSSNCTTIAQFTDYNFNPQFAQKYFNSEVAITTTEAYEKDTSYWNTARPVALTLKEQRNIIVRDSIHDAMNRKEYLDSIDAVFNKVTFLKVIWFGIEHRNRAKKTQWYINSIAALARPLYIAGPRVAPGFSYFKKWKDERTFDSYIETSIGVLNSDIKGSLWTKYVYNPFKLSTIRVNLRHDFDVIVPNDAITQVYKRGNFIQRTSLKIGHQFELFNGFYVDTDADFTERRSLKGYKFLGFFDSLIPNEDFDDFDSYQALIGTLSLSFTPYQKYMREPYRKVILGSKWPTFYGTYERGIPRLFGSDVDHEHLTLGIFQNFQLGTIGTSSYHIKTATFLSAKNLYNADFKFQRRSDPIWFSNPLFSFQDQDSSLPSRDYFIEAHFIHHDNGAIINKIPYMKKTGIGLVFGGGYLYVHEYNWHHYELLAGLERSFRFSRRRLRLGVYGVLSDGNNIEPRTAFKVSFAVLDNRNMKWNF
ncbi:MAG: DUF5686 family protein [Fluviicola sp.]